MADNFEQAQRMNRAAADSLMDVARAKHQAALTPPGADLSARNAQRARGEGWGKTDGPDHGRNKGR